LFILLSRSVPTGFDIVSLAFPRCQDEVGQVVGELTGPNLTCANGHEVGAEKASWMSRADALFEELISLPPETDR